MIFKQRLTRLSVGLNRLLLSAVLGAPIGPVFAQETHPSGPSQAELDQSAKTTDTWLMTNKSYDGHRYVALDQINKDNAGSLHEVCVYDSGTTGPAQSSPVLYDNHLFLSIGQTTVAIDARNCKEIWRYEWVLKDKALSTPNRGVAIKDGKVIRGTSDGFLIALDMSDGKLLWERQITSASDSHYLSMPAMVVEDAIIYGTAGADWGSRGWIGAFSLKDGQQLWRFEALPKPGESGAETWGKGEALAHGGGSFWTPISIDRANNLAFVPIGNPAPDFYGDARKGDNLDTNALAALDLKTGQKVWAHQFVPHDEHDWDLSQTSPLVSVDIEGKPHNLIVVSGKDGRVRLVDRDTHGIFADLAISKQENTDIPVTVDGVHICPGLLGGQEWSSSAYDPQRKITISPMVDWCGTVHHDATAPIHQVGHHFYGGGIDQDPIDQARGLLAAIDVTTAKLRWKTEFPAPMLANVTATKGGVIFAGDLGGTLYAVDADKGDVLLRHPLGSSAGAGMITYALDDKQYVAAVSGRVSAFFPGGTGTTKLTLLALP
ncbi:pyrroloquinoline quinone-dependent dehydrogenase [Beijerinckia indica]|uniref:Pyrrolo-quinoline quinone n=1 Tax=Beijerinckia indica subsp. indica (strain ATCC 9039 / DSM 1715 / NCIMB 8712) TaxID=395963 RepID=B2IJ80_BEII9|nr:PQQ-binding-like beta-propeller repeat protein [Beijerinckia indica]ACB94843.1 Pyrrolo-quinoline quinone [Beijerinckia indica subsp. indica ATCC 9039]